MNKTPGRILIIRLSSLGDVLLTTPIIRTLKTKYPEAKIDFLIREEYSDVVKLNPYLNLVYTISRSEKNNLLIGHLKKNNYDFIVDLQNNFRSRGIRSRLNVKSYSYSKPTLEKFLLVRFKINLLKQNKNIPQRYAEALSDFRLDEKGLDLFIPQNINVSLPFGKYIGLIPGSKHFTKRWPEEYFIELGNLLNREGYISVIFGGKDDKAVCDRISSNISNSINMCNDNNLYETAAGIKQCKLVVTNDSGLMHTTAAVGTRVVVLFGSSVKEFGFTPYGVKNVILENNSLSCRPCSHIGKSSCPKQHFKCMKEITPRLVLENTLKFISEL